jgi:hypothetical protein
LNRHGGHLWSERFGGALDDYTGGVAIDGAGNLRVAGEFEGAFTFAGEQLTSAGESDIFLLKLDKNRKHVWGKRFGDASLQICNGIAVDGADNAVIAGEFSGTLDLGAGPLVSAGSVDMFVAAFGP